MTHHLQREGSPLIPDDGAPVLPARRPTWWTVRTVRAIAFVCVGLAVALSLISTLVSWRSAEAANARAVQVEQRLAALEEYVQGKGEFRDREADRLEQEIRQGICDLADQLPPSRLLDEAQDKYGCAPNPEPPPAPPAAPGAAPPTGVPQSAPSSTPARPAAGATTTAPRQAPPAGRPAPTTAPDGPPATPAPAPSPATPPPPADPPRVVDLEPATDPLCAVLGVCL